MNDDVKMLVAAGLFFLAGLLIGVVGTVVAYPWVVMVLSGG